jgi:hypothetical protein
MKISKATLQYLLKTAIGKQKRPTIKLVFSRKSADISGEFILTASVREELMKIARNEDADYDCLIEPGETESIYLDADMTLGIRMPGDPGPYAEDEDYEEDEDYDFDAIGTWTIHIATREVDFEVDVCT